MRVRGVDIRIHATLFLLIPYLVFITAARYREVAFQVHLSPSDLGFGPIGAGFVMAFGIFVSILLHELSHVRVAQAQGAEVKGITLMMLGGISEINHPSEKPLAELKLAIAGPLMSLVLAAGLWGVENLFHTLPVLHRFPDILLFSYWLSRVNLVLAIFNLLPAFPLDGGRVLRSALASRQGQLRATQVATRVSLGFSWFFGILGVLSFNLLLVLIAFFIYAAAQSELSALLARRLLFGIRAGDLTLFAPPISEMATLLEVSERMLESRLTVLPVESHATGSATVVPAISPARPPAPAPAPAMMVRLEDVRRIPRDFRETTRVKDVMIAVPRTLQVEDRISDVMPELSSSPAAALPVEKAGRIIGLVRYADLSDILQLKSLEERVEKTAA